MKSTRNVSQNYNKEGILMKCAFFIFLFISSVQQVVAQASDEPSLKHLKKNTAALREEIVAEARRREIWGYVFMVVGIIVIFSIAWFSTNNAKKKNTVGIASTKTIHHHSKTSRVRRAPRR